MKGFVLLCLLIDIYYIISGLRSVDDISSDPLAVQHRRALTDQVCGFGWQNFMSHRNSIAKSSSIGLKSPKIRRLVVLTYKHGGFNDRMIGYVTGFYTALVSQRSFHIYRYNEIGIEEVYRPSNSLDWLLSKTQVKQIDRILQQKSESSLNRKPNNASILYLSLDNHPLFNEYINHTIPVAESQTELVILHSNRGNVYRLFTESVYSEYLQKQLHIQPRYAYYCAFHYLFMPSPQVIATAQPYAYPLNDSSRILRIALQIRTGDLSLILPSNRSIIRDLSIFLKFTDCALELERLHNSYHQQERKVLWYIMSDSIAVKRYLQEKFPDKVITNVQNPPKHILNSKNMSSVVEAMRLVSSEFLTLSLCDYFVFTKNSGIGKLGVWLSGHRQDNSSYFYTVNRQNTGDYKILQNALNSSCPSPASDYDMAVAHQGL